MLFGYNLVTPSGFTGTCGSVRRRALFSVKGLALARVRRRTHMRAPFALEHPLVTHAALVHSLVAPAPRP